MLLPADKVGITVWPMLKVIWLLPPVRVLPAVEMLLRAIVWAVDAFGKRQEPKDIRQKTAANSGTAIVLVPGAWYVALIFLVMIL